MHAKTTRNADSYSTAPADMLDKWIRVEIKWES